MGRIPNRGLTIGVLAVTLVATSALGAAPPASGSAPPGSAAPPTGHPPTAQSPTASPAVTALLSVASDGTAGNADSFAPSLSADGSTVAFASLATNFSAPEAVQVVNVFVRDQRTAKTERISAGLGGADADGDSKTPSVSADGSVVAFESSASNLVPGDTNGVSDVFVRDRAAGRTTVVSVDSAGTPGNEGSFTPSISADGRYVAFASDATALVAGDHNRAEDVFVHDRRTGKTVRVSVASDGQPGNGNSYSPAISANGRFVAFASEATNLVRGDTNGATDIFVHDLASGRTVRVSLASNGAQSEGDVFTPSISADGRFVAFMTDAGNLRAGDGNRASDVFVHDAGTGHTVLVSEPPGGHPSDRGSFEPSLSTDGRFVAFVTDGALVDDDTNNAEDIYVAGVSGGAVRRVSLASDGSGGNGPSLGPSLDGDGTVVAFESLASNLVVADSNGADDVFWRR
jgi:Tol biopolymer transport system component